MYKHIYIYIRIHILYTYVYSLCIIYILNSRASPRFVRKNRSVSLRSSAWTRAIQSRTNSDPTPNSVLVGGIPIYG